jgi:hypothetical protein
MPPSRILKIYSRLRNREDWGRTSRSAACPPESRKGFAEGTNWGVRIYRALPTHGSFDRIGLYPVVLIVILEFIIRYIISECISKSAGTVCSAGSGFRARNLEVCLTVVDFAIHYGLRPLLRDTFCSAASRYDIFEIERPPALLWSWWSRCSEYARTGESFLEMYLYLLTCLSIYSGTKYVYYNSVSEPPVLRTVLLSMG